MKRLIVSLPVLVLPLMVMGADDYDNELSSMAPAMDSVLLVLHSLIASHSWVVLLVGAEGGPDGGAGGHGDVAGHG